jgi:hypothetical protein
MKRRRLAFASCLVLFSAACGSGGGGGGGSPPEVSGTVVSPGGALTGSGVPELQPVAFANVFVFEIDDAGNPVGSPLVTTSTDANGAFSFERPTALSSDVIVQVTNASGPSAIAPGAGTLDVPLADEVLDIGPGTELATRQILAEVAADGSTLGHFTPGEVSSFVSLVESHLESQPSLVGSTLEGTISTLEGALPPEFGEVLDAIGDPGEVSAPAAFGGSYHFVTYEIGHSEDARRTVSSGSLSIDEDDGTVAFSLSHTRFERQSACGAGPCDRTFTTITEEESDSGSGTFAHAGLGRILFTFFDDDEGPNTSLGFVSSDGRTIVLPMAVDQNVELVVAVKDGVSLSVSTLNGDYGFASITSTVPGSSVASGAWDGSSSRTDRGSITFSGSGAYTGASGVSTMMQQISCSGPGCNLSATLLGTGGGGPFDGTYTVGSSGALALTDAPDTTDGRVSSNGQTFVVAHRDLSNHTAGIGVGVRRGSAKTLSSLNGDYSFSVLEDLIADDAGATGSLATGTLSFDGSGGVTIAATLASVFRAPCQGGDCFTNAAGRDPDASLSDTGTYTIDATGNATITFGFDPVFNGILSADGTVLVIEAARDDSIDSSRLFGVATKR